MTVEDQRLLHQPVLAGDRRFAVLHLGQPARGSQPRFDPLGQRHLLVSGEKRDLADLLEVHAHRVGRGTGGAAVVGRRRHARRRGPGRTPARRWRRHLGCRDHGGDIVDVGRLLLLAVEGDALAREAMTNVVDQVVRELH